MEIDKFTWDKKDSKADNGTDYFAYSILNKHKNRFDYVAIISTCDALIIQNEMNPYLCSVLKSNTKTWISNDFKTLEEAKEWCNKTFLDNLS